MRKSNMRKWFHLIIDFIPLFIIPIFAININQKSVEPISIEVQEKISVNFNQLYNYENTPNQETQSLYLTSLNGITNINGTLIGAGNPLFNILNVQNAINTTIGHKLYFKGMGTYAEQNEWCLQLKSARSNEDSFTKYIYYDQIYQYQFDTLRINLRAFNLVSGQTYELNKTLQIYDLTQMFGEGNEPTKEEFDTLFNDTYYQYNLGQKMLVNKPNLTTYNNTDIGSQFLYSLYKPVHDYFNISSLGGFSQLYQWIEINLFNGTAPLPFFIVFNIMMYNVIIDLIFILYSVFMFLIDFAEKCLDRFYGRSNS